MLLPPLHLLMIFHIRMAPGLNNLSIMVIYRYNYQLYPLHPFVQELEHVYRRSLLEARTRCHGCIIKCQTEFAIGNNNIVNTI